MDCFYKCLPCLVASKIHAYYCIFTYKELLISSRFNILHLLNHLGEDIDPIHLKHEDYTIKFANIPIHLTHAQKKLIVHHLVCQYFKVATSRDYMISILIDKYMCHDVLQICISRLYQFDIEIVNEQDIFEMPKYHNLALDTTFADQNLTINQLIHMVNTLDFDYVTRILFHITFIANHQHLHTLYLAAIDRACILNKVYRFIDWNLEYSLFLSNDYIYKCFINALDIEMLLLTKLFATRIDHRTLTVAIYKCPPQDTLNILFDSEANINSELLISAINRLPNGYHCIDYLQYIMPFIDDINVINAIFNTTNDETDKYKLCIKLPLSDSIYAQVISKHITNINDFIILAVQRNSEEVIYTLLTRDISSINPIDIYELCVIQNRNILSLRIYYKLVQVFKNNRRLLIRLTVDGLLNKNIPSYAPLNLWKDIKHLFFKYNFSIKYNKNLNKLYHIHIRNKRVTLILRSWLDRL